MLAQLAGGVPERRPGRHQRALPRPQSSRTRCRRLHPRPRPTPRSATAASSLPPPGTPACRHTAHPYSPGHTLGFSVGSAGARRGELTLGLPRRSRDSANARAGGCKGLTVRRRRLGFRARQSNSVMQRMLKQLKCAMLHLQHCAVSASIS